MRVPNVGKKLSIWHPRGISDTYTNVPNVGKKLAIWHHSGFLLHHKFAGGRPRTFGIAHAHHVTARLNGQPQAVAVGARRGWQREPHRVLLALHLKPQHAVAALCAPQNYHMLALPVGLPVIHNRQGIAAHLVAQDTLRRGALCGFNFKIILYALYGNLTVLKCLGIIYREIASVIIHFIYTDFLQIKSSP